MSVHIRFPSSESRLCLLSTDACACFPLPSSGFRGRPLRSPAVPHLHRYYGVVRLLHHPSVPPLVDPRGLRYPPLLHCARRWRALLGSWAIPVEACLGLETPAIPARPRYIGRYQMLPSASLTASASQPG